MKKKTTKRKNKKKVSKKKVIRRKRKTKINPDILPYRYLEYFSDPEPKKAKELIYNLVNYIKKYASRIPYESGDFESYIGEILEKSYGAGNVPAVIEWDLIGLDASVKALYLQNIKIKRTLTLELAEEFPFLPGASKILRAYESYIHLRDGK